MKRILSVLLLLALLAGLCACGTEGAGTQAAASMQETAAPSGSSSPSQAASVEADEVEWVLKTREYQPFGSKVTVRDMARLGQTLLFSLSEEGRHSLALADYSLEESGLSLAEPRLLTLDETDAPDEAFFYALAPGGDDCFYLLTGELPATYLYKGELLTNENRENSYRILRFSREGELENTLRLPAFALEDLNGLGVLDSGHILVYSNTELALLDENGGILHRETLAEEQFVVAAQRCGERLILSAFDPRGGQRFYAADLNSGKARELLSLDGEFPGWTSCQGLGEEYLLQDAGVFSVLDLESGERQELMRWNYRNENCDGALRLGESAFLCRTQSSGTLLFAYLAPQVKTEKQTLRVAVYCVDDYMGLASSAESALRGFENEDPRYRCEITRYEEDELDKLLTLLTTADAPDLVIFNQGINTASPAFEDLYPWLDGDAELSRDSFLPRLLEDLSVNGELHELWTEVYISTLAARVSDVGDGKGLTTADYDRILAENDQYQAIFQSFMDKVNLLKFVSTVGISRYVNRADGSCSFDDPSFRELLAWCSQMCDEQPEGSFDGPVLYPEDVVLWLAWTQSPQQVSLLEENVFHEPFVFVGFPTGDDMGSYYTMEGLAMAIPSAAANKEGAWAFLRSRLLPEEQRHKSFPVNLEAALALARESDTADKDIPLLMDLMEHTGFAENIADEPLREIVMDCGMSYLRGEKTLDDAIALLQSRASIYMSERYG